MDAKTPGATIAALVTAAVFFIKSRRVIAVAFILTGLDCDAPVCNQLLEVESGLPEENVLSQFTVNPNRLDPYKNFKFRVKWDGKVVAGVSRVSGLKRTTQVIVHREGGDPSSAHKMPGTTEFEAITLERGVTHDTEFEKWANKTWNHGAGLGSEVSLKDFRKDIVIELLNEAGQLALAFRVYRCWVSEYSVLPNLDSNSNSVAFESIRIENEGWERDPDVQEPAEPSYEDPA